MKINPVCFLRNSINIFMKNLLEQKLLTNFPNTCNQFCVHKSDIAGSDLKMMGNQLPNVSNILKEDNKLNCKQAKEIINNNARLISTSDEEKKTLVDNKQWNMKVEDTKDSGGEETSLPKYILKEKWGVNLLEPLKLESDSRLNVNMSSQVKNIDVGFNKEDIKNEVVSSTPTTKSSTTPTSVGKILTSNIQDLTETVDDEVLAWQQVISKMKKPPMKTKDTINEIDDISSKFKVQFSIVPEPPVLKEDFPADESLKDTVDHSKPSNSSYFQVIVKEDSSSDSSSHYALDNPELLFHSIINKKSNE